MGFWDAIVLIVLIVSIAQLRAAKYRAGGLIGSRRSGLLAPPQPDSRVEADLADLSRRIAVLERIATEDRKRGSHRDIAAEIEALRD